MFLVFSTKRKNVFDYQISETFCNKKVMKKSSIKSFVNMQAAARVILYNTSRQRCCC